MKQPGKKAQAWGVAAKSEPRWPASLAIVVCALLNFALPGKFTMGPVWLVPLLEGAIVVPLTIASPRRLPQESRWSQIAAVVLIAFANLANFVSLGLLIREIVFNGKNLNGAELLVSSVAIWVTNVIVFGLWYWELDRGGPDDRLRPEHAAPDFLFPQMSTPGCATPSWTPSFVDYLYVAFTNATAFSPTDTMPLSPWAKMLMLVQATISLMTIAIVAARAVNILS
ncbi:MAG: hypothetical protein WAJ85_01330 [Candidatus Baltobacteraceae bacterium]|jgi:uncharacterized membrane protein